MQGQRSNVESLTEAFEFDHAPGSSTSIVDQQIYWNDVMDPPPPIPSYLISPDESSLGYRGDTDRREAVNLNGWHAGASSSRNYTIDEESGDETKVDVTAQHRRDGRRSDRIGINLNQTHEDNDQDLLLGPQSIGSTRVVSQNVIPPADLVCSASGSRRLSGKRKSMEGDSGQSSGSLQRPESSRRISSSALSLSSLENNDVDNVREGNPNPRAAAEDEDAESSYRSFRMRISPNLDLQDDASLRDWPPLLNASSGVPFQLPLHVPVSESRDARLPVQRFPRLVLPLSNTPSIMRNNINTPSDAPNLAPTSELRQIDQLPSQFPLDWNLMDGGNLSNVSGSSRIHYQTLPAGFPRALADYARRTVPISESDSLNPQRSLPSNSGDPAPLPGVGLRPGHQHSFLRSALLMDRRAAVMGAPVAMRTLAASREGRNRMISEHIRSALDLMRRGEGLRFEDVLILDHSAFYGLADLHDRHRDLRLDVDNMSYEELLALEERIGNVNTGLNEETIRKLMKHKIHFSSLVKLPHDVVTEPCCICQENYLDGEEIGILDCGHEFHTNCIKQWLALKNTCPICKLTALGP